MQVRLEILSPGVYKAKKPISGPRMVVSGDGLQGFRSSLEENAVNHSLFWVGESRRSRYGEDYMKVENFEKFGLPSVHL